MVISAKIFEIKEEIEIKEVRNKIINYNYESIKEINGKAIKLLTKIKEVKVEENKIFATFQKDFIIFVTQRGIKNPIIKTYETKILFIFDKKKFLIIFEKKNVANFIANEISKLLFIKIGKITEINIKAENLQRYHEMNKENTKVIFFDNIDIPGIKKLSLYGEMLANSEIYYEYLKHGKIWYIVFMSRIINKVVGLTRNGIIVVFGKISLKDFYSFIFNEILELIS